MGVVGSSPERARAKAEQTDLPPVVESYEALLADEVPADLFTADLVDGIDRYDDTGPAVRRTLFVTNPARVLAMG